MKKRAFTLAEVLITLVIIGVVAALTIPTLMHANRRTEVETRLKKEHAMFAGIIPRVLFDNGFASLSDFRAIELGGMNSTDIFKKYFAPYLKVSEFCPGTTSACSGGKEVIVSMPKGAGMPSSGPYSNYFLLDDGTLVSPWITTGECDNNGPLGIGLYGCIVFQVDINGLKPPNQVGVDYFWLSFSRNGRLNLNTQYGVDPVPSFKANCISGNDGIAPISTYCTTWIMLNNGKIPDDYPWL